MRYRYRFEQFKKKNPEKCNTLTNKLIADLTENEKTFDSLNIINKKKMLNNGKNYNRRRSLVLQKEQKYKKRIVDFLKYAGLWPSFKNQYRS
mgnify:FL=1